MNGRAVLATAGRVLRQLGHDRRTVGMLLVAPCVLLTLFRYVYEDSPQVFDRVGLPLLGIFPLIVMFLVTSVAMVRERTSGTLERLLTTPMHRFDLLAGYALAFGVVALVQASLASALVLGPLGLEVAGAEGTVLVLAVTNALLGMALGLFLSAFATTEFQAVQFMPAFLLPQTLLCGLLTPRDQMVWWLRWISDAMPLSYAVDALDGARLSAAVTGEMVRDGLVVAGCALLALVAGSATLRRRTP